jgi:hypothetical protein
MASLFAEPAPARRYREALAAVGAGPHKANEALAAYRRAERERLAAGLVSSLLPHRSAG